MGFKPTFKPYIGLSAALLIAAIVSGCSSLLYFPDKNAHFYPGQFGIHPVEFQTVTEDGLKLECWQIAAVTQPAKALVVFFHGNGQNLTAQFPMASWLRHFGFDVLMFDYRGYGVSEGSPNPEGTVKDGRAILRMAKDRAGKRPIIAFGQSLGGAILLRSLSDLHGAVMPRMILLDSTFLSYREVGVKVLSHSWITWPFQWLGYLALSDRYAPAGTVEPLPEVPYFVTHGTADRTVDYRLGEKLFAALPGSRKTFVKVEGGEHTDAYFRKSGNQREAAVRWINENLGTEKN